MRLRKLRHFLFYRKDFCVLRRNLYGKGDVMRELSVELSTESKKPLYEQIYEGIKREIIRGTLKEGERLPSTRYFAGYLEVSRSTVELAYDQLLSEGYISSEACRGYFVCDVGDICSLDRTVTGEKTEENRKAESEENRKEKQVYRFDLSPDSVDLSGFPFKEWSNITRELMLDRGDRLLQSGNPAGDENLRESIANYLHRVRGVNCRPGQIVVGAGNEYLQMLLAQILGRKHKIAMENPTYLPAYHTFKNLGYEVVPVELDKDGICIQKLNESGADVAYVMPSHQFPTGVVMPMRRRLQLLGWAMAGDNRYIIEDDYDSEFRYRGKPIPSLQGSDITGKVIYLGTFSRSIAPALRVSYMVLPGKLLERYRERCGFYASTVSRIVQNTLYEFMERGYFERNLNKMRRIYKKRHELLLECLKQSGWCTKIFGEHSGLHLLAQTDTGLGEEQIIERCRKKDIRIRGLSEYDITEKEKDNHPVLILGYGALKEEEIPEAVEKISGIFCDYGSYKLE